MGGFILFDVPFLLLEDGRATPLKDVFGNVRDCSDKTILSVCLLDKDGRKVADPTYIVIGPHITTVCATHNNFAVPLLK